MKAIFKLKADDQNYYIKEVELNHAPISNHCEYLFKSENRKMTITSENIVYDVDNNAFIVEATYVSPNYLSNYEVIGSFGFVKQED